MDAVADISSRILRQDAWLRLERKPNPVGMGTTLRKTPVSDYPPPELVSLLRREFDLLKSLGLKQVVKPLEFSIRDNSCQSVFQDFEGRMLSGYSLPPGDKPSAFKSLALALCDALGEIHRHGLVLCDLNPDAVLWRPDTGELRIVDLLFACPPTRNPSGLERSGWHFPYLSPEITGRLDAPIGYAADLYSLGIVFYELLTGRLPFAGRNPAELIQCHLAKEPPYPEDWDPSLPRGLIDILFLLLSKRPEDRIATAQLLKARIEEAMGGVPGGPHPANLRIPETVHGREREIARILEMLDRGPGKPRLLCIEGEPGAGKTTLASEVRRLAGKHVVFCAGKFPLAVDAKPLSGWSLALANLANQVLVKDASELEAWRKTLRAGLGELGSLMTALAPEWEPILSLPQGRQDRAEPNPNQLALAIHRVLDSFARPETPVVLCFDDFQWADASSLDLLERVLEAPGQLNLLILIATRSAGKEVLGNLEKSVCDCLRLEPLASKDVLPWLEEALGGLLLDGEALAKTMLAKTGGNPFFLKEFLKELHKEGVFRSDPEAGAWRWNKSSVQGKPLTENVAAFLSRKIVELPQDIKSAIQVASWLGQEFDSATFCLAGDMGPEAAERLLEQAVEEGILRREGEGFAFAHDRILEACKALTRESDRPAWQLRVGRLLRDDPAGRKEARLFQVLHHLNAASELVEEPAERRQAASLNLAAGKSLRSLGAISQALRYFEAGIQFLDRAPRAVAPGSEGGWQEDFELAQALHEAAGEAACLAGETAKMERFCGAILARAGTPLQRLRAYEILITGAKGRMEFSSAVDRALEILAQFKVDFPRNPRKLDALVAFMRTRLKMGPSRMARLPALPAMEDGTARAVARILQSIYSAAYLARPQLFPLIVCKHVDLSLRHGNEPYSSATYLAFAIVLAEIGDIGNAVRLGEVALGLVQRFGAKELQAQVFMGFYAFIHPWKRPLRDSLPFVREGYACGMESGDFEYASYLINQIHLVRLHSGDSLDPIAAEMECFRDRIAYLKQERSLHLHSLLLQLVADLRGGGATRGLLQGPHYREQDMLPRHLDPLDQNLVFQHSLAKAMLGLLLGDHQAALQAVELGNRHWEGAFGIYLGAIFRFYESMVFLVAGKPADAQWRRRLVKVAANQRKLAKWSKNAPMNFLHKYHLVEAERHRVSRRPYAAAEHYEKAIGLAQRHGYLQDAALAQERASAFYFGRGMDLMGRNFLRDARHSYQSWGAKAKVKLLESELAGQIAYLAVSAPEYPLANLPQALDSGSVIKASQAISGELVLGNLLEKLIQIMLQQVGGQRGFLILEKDGRLFIEAEADVDGKHAKVLVAEPVERSPKLSAAIVHYVARKERSLVLSDGDREGLFESDPYLSKVKVKSLLCSPLLHQGKLVGLVYLENRLVSHAFTPDRMEVLSLLSGQASISIANANYHALQLEVQQAKINPHFLFNALSSIANLVVADPQTAETAIVKLSNLYRYVLTSSQGKLVSLETELEIVRTYLALEKLRFGAKLDYAVETRGHAASVKLPGLLIQPLVENSIRHGIAPKLGPGRVEVLAQVSDGRCRLVVRDDGEPGSQGSPGTGFGLKSVRQRLSLTYGADYALSITQAGGFCVELEIPIQEAP